MTVRWMVVVGLAFWAAAVALAQARRRLSALAALATGVARAPGVWESRPGVPEANYGLGAAVVDGQRSTLFRYDPAADAWTELPSMPLGPPTSLPRRP